MLNAGAGLDPSRLFASFDLTARKAVIAAVSGGSDSTALLLLLKSFIDSAAPNVRLVAVTIDHALRQSSAAEAEMVAALCAMHGIPHRIMVWSGSKPAIGLPAAARDARYRLLAEAARLHDADLVMTGHTADDQAETVLMRQARQRGRGLAGMAPATLFDGQIWIARPLLGVRRAALRDFLRSRAVSWVEDPTNLDETFERPRLRVALGDGAERDAKLAALLGQGKVAAETRETLGRAASHMIRAYAKLVAPGLVRLDPGFAASDDPTAATYALRILLASIGGTPYLPDESRAAALFERLACGRFSATLSRTLLDARPSGVFMRREARGLPPATAPTDGVIWDGRRRIVLAGSVADGIAIAPFGMRNAKTQPPASNAPERLACAALALEPALWRGDECMRLLSTPCDEGLARSIPVAGPWARFLPCFDVVPAQAINDLIGGSVLTPLPFAGHNAPYSKA